MNEKFTKGPWVADVYSGLGQVDVISDCGRKTLHCNKRHFGGKITDEDEANAHLIAAAPDMYETLSAILRDDIKGVEMCQIIESVLSRARGES